MAGRMRDCYRSICTPHQLANTLMPTMLYMYIEDVDTVYSKTIAVGGESIRKPVDEFYGDRVGAVRDLAVNQ